VTTADAPRETSDIPGRAGGSWDADCCTCSVLQPGGVGAVHRAEEPPFCWCSVSQKLQLQRHITFFCDQEEKRSTYYKY